MARTKEPKVQIKRERSSLTWEHRILGQINALRITGEVAAVKTLRCFLVGIAVATIGFPTKAETLKKEPAMGALKEGQVVFVDDGTCPAGKIKKVIGGNHVKAGGYKQIERIRTCVAR
jgi:uncharacterized protein DUF6719